MFGSVLLCTMFTHRMKSMNPCNFLQEQILRMHSEENERAKQKNNLHSLLKFSNTAPKSIINWNIIAYRHIIAMPPTFFGEHLGNLPAAKSEVSVAASVGPDYFAERMELQFFGPRPNSHRGGPQKSFDAFHQVLGCWVMLRLLAATLKTMVHLPWKIWKAKSAKALREVPANDPRATLEQVLHCVLALSWTIFWRNQAISNLVAGGWSQIISLSALNTSTLMHNALCSFDFFFRNFVWAPKRTS